MKKDERDELFGTLPDGPFWPRWATIIVAIYAGSAIGIVFLGHHLLKGTL